MNRGMVSAGLLLVAACGPARRAEMAPPPIPILAETPTMTPDWSRLKRLLDSSVAAGAAPGAVVAVSVGRRRYVYGTGRLGEGIDTRPDGRTIYDLASVTKVVGLTTATMFAVDEGLLDLDAPVSRYVPAFTGPGKVAVTVRHLLSHASGLPAWRPLYQQATGRNEAMRLAAETPLDTVPGARTVYSDLGIIILTAAIEGLYGTRIDSLLTARLFGPLMMRSTGYLPPTEWWDRIAPTERDPWRGRILRGEVHDENAASLGGVAGHAGLFASAEDLLVFGEWMLDGLALEPGCGVNMCPRARLLPPPHSARVFAHRAGLVPGSSRALGWDTPSPRGSAGQFLSPSSIGHTGFTGTSIWIDPTRDLVIVLLTNRVHPTRDNQRHIPLRPAVADLVVQTLFAAQP